MNSFILFNGHNKLLKLLGGILVAGVSSIIIVLISPARFEYGFFRLDRWSTYPSTVTISRKGDHLTVAGPAAGKISLRYRFPRPIRVDLIKLDSFVFRMKLSNPQIRGFNIKMLSSESSEKYVDWPLDVESERLGIDGTKIMDWQNYKLSIVWGKNYNFDPSEITDLVIDYQIATDSSDSHFEISAPKLWGKIPLPWPMFYNNPYIKPINYSRINKSNIPVFRLEIPPENLKKLYKNFPENSRQEVIAKITNPDKSVHPVTVRLRGDTSVHYEYFKKSWRIVYDNDDLYQGKIKRLNLIIPKNNVYGTVLPYRYASEMGLLSPLAFPARLEINGTDYGIYSAVEQIDDFFLTTRGYDQGLLYFGDMESGETYADPSGLFENDQRWELTRILNWKQNNNIDPLSKLLNIVDLPLDQFDSRIESIIDTESYIKWYVLYQLFNSVHNDDWHNVKIFYNPKTEKFEMIAWDVTPNLSVDPFPRRLVNNRLTLKLFQIPRYRLRRDQLFYRFISEFIMSGKLNKDLESASKSIKNDLIDNIFTLPSDRLGYDKQIIDFYRNIENHDQEILEKIRNPKLDICVVNNSRIRITIYSSIVLQVNNNMIATELEEAPVENNLTAAGVVHRVQLSPKPTSFTFPSQVTISNPVTQNNIYQPDKFMALLQCNT